MGERPALALDRISHAYGDVVAVDELTLDVEAGEVVCLLGPSGCGKSTALRIAAGLEPLQQGRVLTDGTVVAGPGVEVPPERRRVGLVFQDYALFPHLTTAENVGFGLDRLPAAERRQRAEAALRRVGLADQAASYPHTLSGGQQQRAALARALAPEPRVMLMDEPFSGLDARLRDEVRDRTLHVLKGSGAAVLMVTHDPEEAMHMADRIAVMRAGRLVQTGRPVDLYCRPANAFVAAFFGDVNRLPAEARGGRVETPLGTLETEHEGAVEVLIRPEALKLGAEEGAQAVARVVAARMLGRTSLIHLEMPTAHLHARVPGQFLPAEGDRVGIRLDRAQTFVFPPERTL